jgi:hypothetical protein
MSETRQIEWKVEERSVPALKRSSVLRKVADKLTEVDAAGIVQTGDVIDAPKKIAQSLVDQGAAVYVMEERSAKKRQATT